MAIALTFSRANCGVEAPLISVDQRHLKEALAFRQLDKNLPN